MMDQKHKKYLQLHPLDNVLVAMEDLIILSFIDFNGHCFHTREFIPANHCFFIKDMDYKDPVILNGVSIGKALYTTKGGELMSINNVYQDDVFKVEFLRYKIINRALEIN